MGVMFEVALPPRNITEVNSFGRQVDLNRFVDSVLQTIYHASTTSGGPPARRKIIFTSFYPDICVALNWKQPNCEPTPSILTVPLTT